MNAADLDFLSWVWIPILGWIIGSALLVYFDPLGLGDEWEDTPKWWEEHKK